MVYLLRVFHMDQVSASNIINIWSGLTNFGPLLGAFISDTYVGRFKTIAFASFASLLVYIILLFCFFLDIYIKIIMKEGGYMQLINEKQILWF